MTTGYRLVELNAKDGAADRRVRQGRHGRYEGGRRIPALDKQIDLETGEIGLHTTPTVVKDVVIVGSSFKEGTQPETHNNTKGMVRACDVRTGKMLWQFKTIPKKGEFGYDTWLNDSAEVNGNTGVWTADHRGCRPRPRLFAGGRSDVGSVRRATAGKQSLRRQPGLRRSQHGQDEVVLPGRASPHVGLRSLVRRRFWPTSTSMARRSRPWLCPARKRSCMCSTA